jgi:hypothetical protein
MARLSFTTCVYSLAALTACANGAVTVHRVDEGRGAPGATTTASGAATTYTGSAAYDPLVLQPPAPPENLKRDFTIQVSLGVSVGNKQPSRCDYLRSSHRVG